MGRNYKLLYKKKGFMIMKKVNLSYFMLILCAIFILLIHYPRIYGTDSFQVIWMANALREGALFSNNTWLIHPTSYFGYYPFSHRAIGVPLILAFIMSFLEFVSFGIFGLAEAILAFNIILILIIYKSSRNLSNSLFKEEWSRFIFVAAILFSFYITNKNTMIVDTRVIITIIMMVLLNLNLKVLTNSIRPYKATIFLFLLLIVGALSHRLWVGMLIPIVITIFTVIIRKFKNLQKLTLFLILPVTTVAFFVGLGLTSTFSIDFLSRLDPNQTFSPFIDINTLFGTGLLISWFYLWNLGVIFIFFPVGIIITLYKQANLLKKSDTKNTQPNTNQEFVHKYYIILFSIPISFLLSTTFYSIVIFFPIIIIFSVYGIIFVKDLFASYSETLSWFLPFILLIISIVYSFIKVEIGTKIDLWYVYVLSFISLILFLFVFVINKIKTPIFSKVSFKPLKMKKGIWILILTISMLIFSITNIETNRAGLISSLYPWEQRSLTDEEIEIIEYFQNEEIEGLIFTTDPYVDLKISGAGFLPTFHGRPSIGLALMYGLLSPKDVLENTEFSFSLSSLFDQNFFWYRPKTATFYWETSPLEVLRRKIIILNMTYQEDRALFRSEYNVQYIISVNDTFSHAGNEWTLIRSLYQSEIEPVFSTQHLLIWKIII